ncbi:MAG: chromate transporter, partial [Acetobacteraceae bacterium]|nr:chromate transporter [Acetobacteraceae bacterium]
GLAAAAAALVLATACRIAAPLCARPLGAGVAALTFGTVAVLRLPLPLAVVVLLPVSVLLAWRAGAGPR